MSHTPGPWKTPQFEELGPQPCGCYNSPHKYEDEWCDEHRPLAEADARLIAAAPDLLAALNKADDFLRRLSEWDMLHVPDDGRPPVTADGPYWQREIANVRASIMLSIPGAEVGT